MKRFSCIAIIAAFQIAFAQEAEQQEPIRFDPAQAELFLQQQQQPAVPVAPAAPPPAAVQAPAATPAAPATSAPAAAPVAPAPAAQAPAAAPVAPAPAAAPVAPAPAAQAPAAAPVAPAPAVAPAPIAAPAPQKPPVAVAPPPPPPPPKVFTYEDFLGGIEALANSMIPEIKRLDSLKAITNASKPAPKDEFEKQTDYAKRVADFDKTKAAKLQSLDMEFRARTKVNADRIKNGITGKEDYQPNWAGQLKKDAANTDEYKERAAKLTKKIAEMKTKISQIGGQLAKLNFNPGEIKAISEHWHKKNVLYISRLERAIELMQDYIVQDQAKLLTTGKKKTAMALGAYNAEKEVFEISVSDSTSQVPFNFSGVIRMSNEQARETNRKTDNFTAGVDFINYPLMAGNTKMFPGVKRVRIYYKDQELQNQGNFKNIKKVSSTPGYSAWRLRADSLLNGKLVPKNLDSTYAMGGVVKTSAAPVPYVAPVAAAPVAAAPVAPAPAPAAAPVAPVTTAVPVGSPPPPSGISGPCLEEVMSIAAKSDFSMGKFATDLPPSVAKVKVQMKSPFGKPKDEDKTSVGMSVGCVKALPESPAAIQPLLKDMAIYIGYKLGKDFAEEKTIVISDAVAPVTSVPTGLSTSQPPDNGTGPFWTKTKLRILAFALSAAGFGLGYMKDGDMDTEVKNANILYNEASQQGFQYGPNSTQYLDAHAAYKSKLDDVNSAETMRNAFYIGGGVFGVAGIVTFFF